MKRTSENDFQEFANPERNDPVFYYPLDMSMPMYCCYPDTVCLETDEGIRIKVLKNPVKPNYIHVVNSLTSYSAPFDSAEIPKKIQDDIQIIDMSYNCFGYIFLEGKYWLNPHGKEINEQIKILLNDGKYEEKPEAVKGCIALFLKGGKYLHVARYINTDEWEGKMAIYPLVKNNFAYHKKHYTSVEYYLKQH